MIDRSIALLLLSMVPVATGGCVTAGFAIGGPVISSLVAVSDRSVERTIPADLPTTAAASADALSRMAFRIEKTEKGDGRWLMTSSAGDVTVHASKSADTISLLNAELDGDLFLNLGRGRNFVSVDDSMVAGQMSVWTGKQADFVVVQGSTVGGLHAVTGRRNDEIILRDTTIDGDFQAFTGDERDFVLMEDLTAYQDAQVGAAVRDGLPDRACRGQDPDLRVRELVVLEDGEHLATDRAGGANDCD